MKRRELIASVAPAAVLTLWLGPQHLARGAGIVAVRIWPAKDYTRVTIESDTALKAKHTFVADPPRLAVDIDGIELAPGLRELVRRVQSDDPNVSGIRVGQKSPQGVRLVVDLKKPMAPQVFSLPPVAAYQHRLVLDLYPAVAADPLEELIQQRLQEIESTLAAGPTQGAAAPNASNPGGPTPVGGTAGARAAIAPSPAPDPLGALIDRQLSASTTAPVASPGAPSSAPAALAARPPRRVPSPQAPAVTPTNIAPAPGGVAPDRPSATGTDKTDRLIVVALDPGHGGEDPGAIGPNGTQEKAVVLQIAHRLRAKLNASQVNGNPVRVYMTRDDDFFVPLHVRVDKARRVQADLFVSLHADAFYTPRPQGASVYALSERGASSAAARWIANKENQADLVGGLNVEAKDATVQRALFDMSTTAQIKDSLKLGSSLLGEIQRVGRLHKPQVEQASFAVLKAPDIPSVLVETAFISNPDEEARLNDPAYQEQLADALVKGIRRYFASHPPLARSRQL